MKKFMKFIPVALGMLMLASCSNDDFLGDNTKTDIYADLGDGDMVVHAPKPLWGGDAVTRALRDFVPGKQPLIFYQRNDILRVYDDALTKWDIYEYRQKDDQDPNSPLKFRRRHVTNLNGPATYALYPKEDVIDAKWEYTNEELNQTHTVAWVNIAPKMEYVAGYDRQTDPDNKYARYQDRLPQWGQVISSDKGYVETHIEYLTGILCVQMAGVNEYAKWLRVQLIDKDGKALNIAGQAQVELAVNDKLKVAYETDGITVIESETARITTNDFVKGAKQEIVVDMTKDVQLSDADRKHAKIFVPLACTDLEKKAVCIQVSYSNEAKAPTTDEAWIPCWSQCNTVIERGRYYWNDPEINLAIDGTTPCAISDALELMAQEAEGKIVLSTTNPIMINSECKRIVIPNTEYPVVIDLSNGVYGETAGETLTIEYDDPDGEIFPSTVTLIADCARIDGTTTNDFALDVQLPKSAFSLVDACPIAAAAIDATSFVVGDGETRTELYAENLVLSDNVKSLTVAENAELDLGNEMFIGPYSEGNCAITIPDEHGKAGYQNKGLEEITINGIFRGYIDARTAEVNVTVEPGMMAEYPAAFFGGIRTLGEINAFQKAILISPAGLTVGDGDPVPFMRPCTDIFGFAAQKDVTVTGQSFIIGPVFSWQGDIDITNENLNEYDYWMNGGKLSNLIYDKRLYLPGSIKFGDENFGYGPLYAEEGSVKIEATNSKVVVVDKPKEDADVEMIAKMLNPKAAKAVTFAVYAAQDIDLNGEDITVYGKMWAEEDINVAGHTTLNRGVWADQDFKIEDTSLANYVFVGRNATVDVDEQNGNCVAIKGQLQFTANEAEGNALTLKQGYINKIVNGTEAEPVEVKLYFSEEPAYAAIGEVTAPDALISQNKSIWNGKMMPSNLWSTYQNFKDIWTATQLAIQLKNPVSGLTLRSNIDLKGEKWAGTEPKADTYVLHGNDHTIMNLNITGRGFINRANALEVDNLTLSNVETNIPMVPEQQIVGNDLWSNDNKEKQLYGVGSLAGGVEDDATLSRVLVVLKNGSTFGSDGKTNKLAYGIGGVLGYVYGDIDFDGVRINANESTLGGWCYIGGLVGYAEGEIKITNGKTTDKYTDIFKTQVNKLKAINVTYLDKRAVNDPQQGKTGLYIGGCDLDDEIYIYSSDDVNKKLTITGLADESKAFDQQEMGRFFFLRGQQTFIGNSGYDDPVEVPYHINNKLYAVEKTGSDFKSGMQRLYGLQLEDVVDEWNYGMGIDFQTLP